MATLAAGISASDGLIPLSAAVDIGYYTIDSENIYVTGMSRGADGRDFERLTASVERGVGGSTPASHLSAATLTRYYPDAVGGGGGDGLTNPVGVPLHVEPTEVTPEDEEYLFFLQTPEDYDQGWGEVIQVQNFAGEQIFALNVFGQIDLGAGAGFAPIIQMTGESPSRTMIITTGAESLDIVEARDSAGKVVFKISPTGITTIGATAAPADAALAAGQVALWFDATNGAAKLMIKGKSANGTIVVGEVALT